MEGVDGGGCGRWRVWTVEGVDGGGCRRWRV